MMASSRLARRLVAVGFAVAVPSVVGLVRHRRAQARVRSGLLPPVGAATLTLPPRPEDRLSGALAVWLPAPPRGPVGQLAAALWAGPGTLVGAVLGATTGGVWRRDEDHHLWLVEGGERGVACVVRWLGFEASAVGQVVLSRSRPIPPIVAAHEAVHVRQWERLGILLVPLYLWFWARRGYRGHPLERAARLGAALAATSDVLRSPTPPPPRRSQSRPPGDARPPTS